MINGAHFLLYSTDAEADRAFLTNTLGFQSVDAGGGWLIFALPPAELAVHPVSGGAFSQRHADVDLMGVILYLMCDDVEATRATLIAHGVACTPIQSAEWGRFTTLRLPSGGSVGLYQPAHPVAIGS